MGIKIKQLIESWPRGAIRSVSALKLLGYSQNLLNRYRYSGWLKSVGEGAVMLSKDEPNLLGAFFALQHDLKLNVHIGGRSALELKGRAHYIRQGKQSVWIFGEIKRLPAWFVNYKWKEDLHLIGDKFLATHISEGLEPLSNTENEILISSDLRAMLELLTLVPTNQSFDEARELMRGLTDAHPKQAINLLKGCRSVKAKRLFLLLAEVCGHEWVKKINNKEIYLGSGVRQLVPGGKLNKKYQIIIPASLYLEESS